MLGGDVLIETLANGGVECCFLNPGTTEIQTIAALQGNERMRSVLTLCESVAAGAADGYARMAGKPAATLLHQGVGLANGLANLHNARKAGVPLVNIVGTQSRAHLRYETPLGSDVPAFAAPVSGWVRQVERPADLGRDAARALAAALGPPAQVATLVVPGDCAWREAGEPAPPAQLQTVPRTSPEAVTAAAVALRSGQPAALILGGPVLLEEDLVAIARIGHATGARLIGTRFFTRIQRGAGRVDLERLPYLYREARADVAALRHAVLVGAPEPVTFFDLPDGGGPVLPEACAITVLEESGGDVSGALRALADALEAVAEPAAPAPVSLERPRGKLSAAKVAATLALDMPADTIVSDDANTSGVPCFELTRTAAPHDWLALTGGGLGQGLTAASGAAIACPDSNILCLQGDGGAMYTCQALWTHARERLNITTVVFANRSYAVLRMELARLGLDQVEPAVGRLVDIDDPALDFVKLAEAMGVEAMRADTAETFSDRFQACMRDPGPQLIEAVV